MNEPPISSVVFSFEEVSPTLDLLPVAARRALDHSGLRLSLEGWRSLSLDDRRRVALAGGDDQVDAGGVVAVASRANPLPQAIEALSDPDPMTPPVSLLRALEPTRSIEGRSWARLRSLDRYALAHAHRRSIARNDPSRLIAAFDAILRAFTSNAVTRRSVPPGARTSSVPPSPSSEDPPSVDSRPPSSLPPPPAPPPVPAQPQATLTAAVLSSHLTAAGAAQMVDVGAKPSTARRAVASGSVKMKRETIARLTRNDTPKGEVLATARIAGIMAAKRTPELIPLCHGVALTSVTVHIDIDSAAARVNLIAVTEAQDRTGVEMEAMLAVSVACLTIYDMLKGIDREMTISEVKLLEKSGGKSGHFRREAP